MGKFIDMTGWVMAEHGVPESRLTVINRASDSISPCGALITMWNCKCECGNMTTVSGNALRGTSKRPTLSCGCIWKEKINKWSKSDEDLLKQMFVDKTDVKMISKILQRSISGIQNKLRDMGLSNEDNAKFRSDFKAIYQDFNWCYERFVNRGMDMHEMAKEANCSLRVMQKWCSEKHGLNDWTFRHEKKLNELQKQIVMFGLLGDGHIDKRPNQPMYIESHAENQKDYVYWKYSILKDLCNKEPVYKKPIVRHFSCGDYLCQGSYRINTRVIDDLGVIRGMSKFQIMDNLNELGLCLHLLDDGCRCKSNWELCVASFTDEEKLKYVEVCKTKFGIEPYITSDVRYMKFRAEDSRRIDKMILQNIPNELDIVKYKILLNKHISKPLEVKQ